MAETLLVELGCEELPKGACRVAERAGEVLRGLLEAQRLPPAGEVRTIVTPRRIAVLAEAVPEHQGAERISHRGPPLKIAVAEDGTRTKAAAGFAARHGLTAADLLERDGFLWAVVDAETGTLAAHAQALVDGLVGGLQVPKNMRWADQTLRFARPIRTLTVLHGSSILECSLAGVAAGRTIRGHRLVAPSLELASADGYLEGLAGAGVIGSTSERRVSIVAQLDAAASELGVSWTDPGSVLDEVVYLVEAPRVIAGAFAEDHLQLPDRVLVTAMQSHQRYLPLDQAGTRWPGFLTVVNSLPAADEVVRIGNERVLHGRLADAAFSQTQDLAVGLEAMEASLGAITYHAKAGTLADRSARIEALTETIAGLAGVGDLEPALTAARLAKADQASKLVSEFAELEGYVGGVYALHAGLSGAVAQAITEQYLPDHAGGETPASEAGALVALSDKLDALVSMFGIGERPSGSRDPYALRRAAAGIVSIVLERGWDVPLERAVGSVFRLLERQGASLVGDEKSVSDDVTAFVLDRVDAVAMAEGIPIDTLRTVRGSDLRSPVRYLGLARSLQAARGGAAFDAMLSAFTRASRLAARAVGELPPAIDPSVIQDPAERELAEVSARIAPRLEEDLRNDRFAEAISAAAELGAPVERFFDAVMVMDDDPRVRANRLLLLRGVAGLVGRLGALEELQVEDDSR